MSVQRIWASDISYGYDAETDINPEYVLYHDYKYLYDTCIMLASALSFYGNPASYHAVGFWVDPPAGGFADDFSEDHGDDYYDRDMPGKLAREVLATVRERHPE